MIQTIQTVSDRALQIIHNRADHWLPPYVRQQLYAVLDPVPLPAVQSRVRSWLEYLTASYVLPLWTPIRTDPEQVWRDYYDAPQHMVEAMNVLLHQSADTKAIYEQASHWLEVADLTGELSNSQFYPAWCVNDATLTALWYMLGDDFFARASITDATLLITDRYSDTANWAAIAYAGGIWQPDPSQEKEYGRIVGSWYFDCNESRQRRLQFWEWWLQEAVPSAYSQAVSSH